MKTSESVTSINTQRTPSDSNGGQSVAGENEIQNKLLRAIDDGRSTVPELRTEIGGPLDWHTQEELAVYAEAGRQISGLVAKGLAFTSQEFRQPARYKLTRRGRTVLKASA